METTTIRISKDLRDKLRREAFDKKITMKKHIETLLNWKSRTQRAKTTPKTHRLTPHKNEKEIV